MPKRTSKAEVFKPPPRQRASLEYLTGFMQKTPNGGDSNSPAPLPRAERTGRYEGHAGHKVGDGKSD